MPFQIPPLPYRYDALWPWLSDTTLRIHHELQCRYVDRLNDLAPDTDATLESIIVDASPGPILDNALQIWNHTFLWSSMTPEGGGEDPVLGRDGPRLDCPLGVPSLTPFADALRSGWPTWWNFIDDFSGAARSIFGSGYVWLLADPAGTLAIWPVANAGNPLRSKPGWTPILNLDVWEHAYFLDYQAERLEYVDIFWARLANWAFAERNYVGRQR